MYHENIQLAQQPWLLSQILKEAKKNRIQKAVVVRKHGPDLQATFKNRSVLGRKIDKKFPKQTQFTTQREKEKKKKMLLLSEDKYLISWDKFNSIH